MNFSTFLLAILSFVAPLAQAQYANVLSQCLYNVFVQSVPYDPNSTPGPLTKLTAGQTYTEKLNLGGSTLKLARDRKLSTPLFGGYSLGTNPNNVYYELKDTYGNPFINSSNSMGTTRAGCPRFTCVAGNKSPTCYSTGGTDAVVYMCKRPTNVTVTLCSA